MRELDLIAIGLRIKEKREQFRYSREEFSELASISPKHCREIENGATGMSMETLVNIADVLKMSLDYIVYGKDLTGSEQYSMMVASCDESEQAFIGGVVTEMVRQYNRKYESKNEYISGGGRE